MATGPPDFKLLAANKQLRATFTESETTQELLRHSMRAFSSAGSPGVSITLCSLIQSLKPARHIFSPFKILSRKLFWLIVPS